MTRASIEPWLLPEGVEEVLPGEAWAMEHRRRHILDLFRSFGYELVTPPLAEYRNALLAGIGSELQTHLFTVTDPLSGRLMGIRPDMTPQVARIDAHYLRDNGVTRLCYTGPTLLTRPRAGSSREPLQCGAELFGSDQPQADSEVIELMIETARATGIDRLHLDVGHIGVFRALAADARLSDSDSERLFEALQRKSKSDVSALLANLALDAKQCRGFEALVDLSGPPRVIARARELFENNRAITVALDNLTAVITSLRGKLPQVPVHIDLAELRGYRYQNAVVFALFTPSYGRSIARGGRYDNIGGEFGRSRPATGFSADLRVLLRLGSAVGNRLQGAIAVPVRDDPQLAEAVRALRAQGESVIYQLPGESIADMKPRVDRQLRDINGHWSVVSSDD